MEVLVKKCINAKNYALTVNKEYNVVEQGSYFVLTNDNNKNQRYHRSLFEDVVEEVAEVINVSEWSIDRNGSNIVVKVILSNNTNLINRSINILDTSSCSGLECCGLREIDGIETFYFELVAQYDNFLAIADNANIELPFSKERFIKIGFKSLFVYYFGGMSIIISTVQESVVEIIDSLSDNYNMVKQEGINTNSSNHLYVYLVQKPESFVS